MKQKRISLVFAAAALLVPCFAVHAAQNNSGEVKSYGTIVYEENGSQARIYGEDFAFLEEKVSSIPITAFDPALFSTPGNADSAALLQPICVYEEIEGETAARYQAEPDPIGEAEDMAEVNSGADRNDGTAVDDEIDGGNEDDDGNEPDQVDDGVTGDLTDSEIKDESEKEIDTEEQPDDEETKIYDSVSSNTTET